MRENNPTYINLYGLFSNDTRVLERERCSHLKQAILARAEDHEGATLYRTQSSQNYPILGVPQGPGGGHEKHNHTNSILSGVYYYDDIEDYAPIRFWKDKSCNTYQIELELNQQTDKQQHLCMGLLLDQTPKNDVIFFPLTFIILSIPTVQIKIAEH